MLDQIRRVDRNLSDKYKSVLLTNGALDRRLVSFQASKSETESRWYKYKEGFSSSLIRYVFEKLSIPDGPVLDPFAGSGTTMFVAASLGTPSVGIELLPSTIEAIEVRNLLLDCKRQRIAAAITVFSESRAWENTGGVETFSHIKITNGAFPPETEHALCRYLYEAGKLGDKEIARVLRFAAMCVLEEISYTRKDGQYLRWDYRSGRKQGVKPFDKGKILAFTDAITSKIREIVSDLSGSLIATSLFPQAQRNGKRGDIRLLGGSCLTVLPTIAPRSFSAIITSPPYCNRYDYTRTYALELAMMGIGEDGIRALRQTMLSSTVENREKPLLEMFTPSRYQQVMDALASQEILRLILEHLDEQRLNGKINNSNIPRMVKNYFTEMAFVVFECARVLKPGAPMVMVNDNVRYEGAHVPVDLILSEIAKQAGFDIEAIWVLPRGKGNSSQQMGQYGREEIRKCVYVWKRAKERSTSQRDRRPAVARSGSQQMPVLPFAGG